MHELYVQLPEWDGPVSKAPNLTQVGSSHHISDSPLERQGRTCRLLFPIPVCVLFSWPFYKLTLEANSRDCMYACVCVVLMSSSWYISTLSPINSPPDLNVATFVPDSSILIVIYINGPVESFSSSHSSPYIEGENLVLWGLGHALPIFLFPGKCYTHW